MDAARVWAELEDCTAQYKDSLVRQYAGWDVTPAEFARQAEAVRVLAEKLSSSFRDDPDRWAFLSGIIRRSHLEPLELAIDKLSEQHFTFTTSSSTGTR